MQVKKFTDLLQDLLWICLCLTDDFHEVSLMLISDFTDVILPVQRAKQSQQITLRLKLFQLIDLITDWLTAHMMYVLEMTTPDESHTGLNFPVSIYSILIVFTIPNLHIKLNNKRKRREKQWIKIDTE